MGWERGGGGGGDSVVRGGGGGGGGGCRGVVVCYDKMYERVYVM